MGTRSDIIVERADGKWSRIYCHWDGYLDHNGRILAEDYSSQERAEELVSHGDLSVLAPRCDKPDGHTFDTPAKGHCIYYGRDRGETGTEATVGESLEEVWPEADTWTEFTYVWKRGNGEGKWWVADPAKPDGIVLLSDALQGINKPTPIVKAFGIPIGRHT